jgi:hypothetical protein
MTGLEPHPVFTLPTRAQMEALERAVGREEAARRLQLLASERARKMELAETNPLHHGFRPEVWNLVDDLLVDGNRVVIDLERLKRLTPEGMVLPPDIEIPVEMEGRPEIWIGGSNRSSKSEYGVSKVVRVQDEIEEARTWSFADTGPISVARQQPVFWKYLPPAEKKLASSTGKMRQGAGAKITYSKAGGFAGETYVLMNLSQHWFKNYAQDIENMEGDQLDAVLLDELRNVMLLKTIRGRMGDRGGIIIVSFTAIDENYSEVVDEYDRGSRTVLEVPAELLPLKDAAGQFNGRYKKVPRLKVAGLGSDGDQRANIVYFHITDNPFYGFSAKPPKPGEGPRLVGKERFYRMYRYAVESKILARVYGLLTRGNRQVFPEFNEAIHVIDPEKIPRASVCTNFHVVDPHDGKNWAMLWPRRDPRDRLFIAREWPSSGHTDPSAYVPGIGDPGAWALPGSSRVGNAKPPEDGSPGPAQNPFGFGLSRYKQEILRLEGHAEAKERSEVGGQKSEEMGGAFLPGDRRDGGRVQSSANIEEIFERLMDSRYGAAPTTVHDGQTTLIQQMGDMGLEFRAASGKDISEGIDLIHEMLDYDKEVPIGEWSPRLARVNEPLMKISRNCTNLIFALKIYTGRDGQKGAVKEWVDLLRYFLLADLHYVGPNAFQWRGGGSY